MDFLIEHLKGFGTLFYMVNPYDTMFENLDDLPHPNYTAKAAKYFLVLAFLEHLVLCLEGKPGIRINDGISSMSNGLFMFIKDFLIKGILYTCYIYIYEHYRIYTLPWDSIWTWLIAAICYDLGYYTLHRAAHEINVMWAAHQVHHSSEEFNLTTAMRQSFMQKFVTWFFYLPMAFFVPPTHMIIHGQFNLLFQFWIHTEVVRDLGPLEYIFNTAKHHRVHHGSNRYCLDKNYAGTLIIWDRLFGTFEWEREDEKIVYGLVDQPQFFNPVKIQVFYYGKIFQKAMSMDNWSDRLSALFKGPGWFPGTGRLGDNMMVPEQQDRIKYDPKVPSWVNVYTILHFFLVFLAFDNLAKHNLEMTQTSVLAISGFLIWTLTSIGMIFDKNQFAWMSEIGRSVTFLVIYQYFGAWSNFLVSSQILNSVFIASIIVSAYSVIAFAENVKKSSESKKMN